MSQHYDITAHQFKQVPDWLQDELRAYILEGTRPGEFLFNLLCSDVHEAHSINPNVSQMVMTEILNLMFEHFIDAWGCLASVHEWMEHEGLKGLAQHDPCALSIGPNGDQL